MIGPFNVRHFLTFLGILLFSIIVFAMNGRTTYQAKIVKPDGYPLESANVNFQFAVLDTVGACILYTESYTAVDMRSTGGFISFALGNGTRGFPASGTTALFSNVFDNSIVSMPCQNPGIYNPGPNDNRKVVMQFNDGNGWQTLPAMTINAVPYAMYAAKATDSKTLNGKADTAFVENSTLAALNCNPATHAITFNGVSFSCIPVGASSGGVVTSVTASGSVLSVAGTTSAPVISIQAATMSQDGYLTSLDYAEFKAKLSASSSQVISSLGYAPVSSSAVAAQIDSAATTSATANALVKRDASGNASFSVLSANTATLNYVDIYRPSSSFNIRLQAPTSLSANYTLNLPTTSGTAGQVISTDGLGNLSWIDAATGSVTSVSGAANEITTSGGSNPTLGLANVGTAGTYFKVTTDNKGRVSSGVTTLTLSDLPASLVNSSSNFSGDISGLISNITVNRIQGVSVTVSSLSLNDILQYDGSKYINKNIPTCAGTQYLTFNGTSFSCVADAGASGTITTISVTGPISSTGGSNPTLSIAQANVSTNGYLSATDFNTFNNKQIATSAAIIATLGYTPADSAVSGAYLQKANNLSDLTNAAVARNNLELGSFAVANNVDLGSASATGTLATGRIPAFIGDATVAAASNTIILSNSGVTAGTYTKLTVDAKGRVTSSSALASGDVTTALGYTPVSAAAASQWTTSGATINYMTGNVGIGTNTPSDSLSVSGIIQTTSGFKFPDGSIQTTAASGVTVAQSSVWFFVADTTYNTPAATANLVITMGKQYTSGSSNFNPSVTQAGHTTGVNGFDGVNGRFIPPVAGRYYFQAQASASLANGFVAISKNGTILSQAMMYGYASNVTWMSGNASVILDLTTSDIITFTYYATNGLTISQTYNYQINGFLLPSQSVVDAKYILGAAADAGKLLKLSSDGQTITKSLTLVESTSGNVGIGTASPNAKLDVAGTIDGNFQGFSYYATGAAAPSGWNAVVVSSLDYNSFGGSTYNTGTGVFTAPKTGFYRFSLGGWASANTAGNDRYALGIAINGTSTLRAFGGGQFSGGDSPIGTFTHVVYLNAGATVRPMFFNSIAAITLGNSIPGHEFWFQGEFVGK